MASAAAACATSMLVLFLQFVFIACVEAGAAAGDGAASVDGSGAVAACAAAGFVVAAVLDCADVADDAAAVALPLLLYIKVVVVLPLV